MTWCRRQGSRPSPWKRNAKKQHGCLGYPLSLSSCSCLSALSSFSPVSVSLPRSSPSCPCFCLSSLYLHQYPCLSLRLSDPVAVLPSFPAPRSLGSSTHGGPHRMSFKPHPGAWAAFCRKYSENIQEYSRASLVAPWLRIRKPSLNIWKFTVHVLLKPGSCGPLAVAAPLVEGGLWGTRAQCLWA